MLNKHAGSTHFSLGNKLLEQVDEHNYIGQVVSSDANHEKEICCRMGMG